LQPKFGNEAVALHMNVGWFIAISGKKEKTKRAYGQDSGHGRE